LVLCFCKLIDIVDCEFEDGASIKTEDDLDIYQGSRYVRRTKIDKIGFSEVKCESGLALAALRGGKISANISPARHLEHSSWPSVALC
jgi:hypothetical protein